jgi:hypothetical protein
MESIIHKQSCMYLLAGAAVLAVAARCRGSADLGECVVRRCLYCCNDSNSSGSGSAVAVPTMERVR